MPVTELNRRTVQWQAESKAKVQAHTALSANNALRNSCLPIACRLYHLTAHLERLGLCSCCAQPGEAQQCRCQVPHTLWHAWSPGQLFCLAGKHKLSRRPSCRSKCTGSAPLRPTACLAARSSKARYVTAVYCPSHKLLLQQTQRAQRIAAHAQHSSLIEYLTRTTPLTRPGYAACYPACKHFHTHLVDVIGRECSAQVRPALLPIHQQCKTLVPQSSAMVLRRLQPTSIL